MTTSTTVPPAVPDPHHEAHRPRPASAWESLATGCALVVCVLAQLPHRILDATGVRGWAWGLVVAVALVSGVRALARAPFALRHSSVAGELKIAVASLVVGSAATLPLYALLRATPLWWLWAGLLFATVTVVWQVAAPLALRAQAGPNDLAARVEALAGRAGVDVAGRVVVAGRPGRGRCNAYVVGLGPTRRLVLEPAVTAWPDELVDQAVAHELGHWRLRHAARRLPLAIGCQLVTLAVAALALSSPALLGVAGLTAAGDPRSYPLLLVVGAVLALPARSLLAGRDRAQERAADRFALTLLDRPADFNAMLERAAAESGTPTRLPWWRRATASHPPVDERMAA